MDSARSGYTASRETSDQPELPAMTVDDELAEWCRVLAGVLLTAKVRAVWFERRVQLAGLEP
jgi:hypothetical protein